jgi:hypothetical protein
LELAIAGGVYEDDCLGESQPGLIWWLAVVGLDIYVGTLSRYYLGDWQTIIQQSATTADPVILVSGEPRRIDSDPRRVVDRVVAWRTTLEDDLRKKGFLPEPFDWLEDPSRPYFTDKPGWEPFGALVLLAAYTDTSKPVPTKLREDWHADPTLSEASSSSVAAYWSLYETEMWFPVADMVVCEAVTLTKKSVRLASVPWLRYQLTLLNARVLGGSPEDLGRWNRSMPPDGSDLLELARAGLAITLRLAREAEKNDLPMLLDY